MVKSAKVKAPAGGERNGVRSLAVGAGLLQALARHNGAATLSALASAAEMAPAKAHRYLAGYIEAGLAEQDAFSGRYRLGPLALEIGLAAMRRLDVLAVSEDILIALRDDVGEAISLTVWGNLGPTVVRWVEGRHAFGLATQLGAVLPVTRSANGLIFSAFLVRSRTAAAIEAELGTAAARADFDAATERIRSAGIAFSDAVQPGVVSIAVPIVNYAGNVVASLAIVGMTGTLDLDLDGAAAHALRAAAAHVSRRLGAGA